MTRVYSDQYPQICRLQGVILFPHDIREESVSGEDGKSRTVYSCVLLRLTDRGQPISDGKAFAARHYDDIRAQLYPPIQEQLDKIYHAGIDAWKAEMIAPVKSAYPKSVAAVEAAAVK